MRAPFELHTLEQLRSHGQVPSHAIYITNQRDDYTRNWIDAGHLVIPVVSDHWRCDWSCIAGLDVILYLSFEATPVGTRMAVAIKNHRPRRLRFWQPIGSAIAVEWHDYDGFSVACPAPRASMDEDAA